MKPCDVAKTIIDNATNDTNLTIADIIIERNQRDRYGKVKYIRDRSRNDIRLL